MPQHPSREFLEFTRVFSKGVSGYSNKNGGNKKGYEQEGAQS